MPKKKTPSKEPADSTAKSTTSKARDTESLDFMRKMLTSSQSSPELFEQESSASNSNSTKSAKNLTISDEQEALLLQAQEIIQNYENSKVKLQQEQEALAKDRVELTQKIKDFEREKKSLLQQKNEIETERLKLTQRDNESIAKARELAERDANAQTYFAQQNQEALEQFQSQIASLRNQLGELRVKLAEERTVAIQQWELERKQLYQAAQDSLQQERQQAMLQMAEQRQQINQDRQKFLQEYQQFDETKRQIEIEQRRKQNQLKIQEEMLEEDRLALDKKIELKAGEELKRLRAELQISREFVQLLQKERSELEGRLRAYEEINRKLGNREPEEILKELKRKEQEIQKLRVELSERPGLEFIQQVKKLEQERDELKRQLTDITYQYARVKSQEERTLIAATEQETLREANRVLMIRCEQAMNSVAKLEEEVNKYKKINEVSKERQVRIGMVEEPIYDIQRDPPNFRTDEFEWLEAIHQEMENCSFHFPKRLLYAFHTSLKIAEWSSLTVLTGVSGTGKSELPRLYARFGGLEFEALAVQPNWDSPQDLFGFFNYMDNRFNAKALLRAMVQSQLPKERGGFDDGILLVLLDEMNLARVEQYFSDLLSKLELRRGESETVYLNIDLGSGLEPYSVPLGKNIFFVGTINEDESTQTLSDKTLDRSNVIAFPSPRQFRSREILTLGDRNPFFNFSVWQSWLRDPSCLKDDIRTRLKTTVEEINQSLATIGRALGHRVWQSMEHYIANHPEVCKALKDMRIPKESNGKSNSSKEKTATSTEFNGKGSSSKDKATSEAVSKAQTDRLQDACQKAFEDQIVQKIMPKLRGIETEGNARKYCLDPIAEILRKEAIGLLEDYHNACEKGHGTFLWHSAKYIEDDEAEKS